MKSLFLFDVDGTIAESGQKIDNNISILHRPERKMRQTHPKFRWLEALPSVKSTDGLTFSSSFLVIEEVKDEIQNSLGLCCL